jgi:dTDP-glucose 4,6-dehydratase
MTTSVVTARRRVPGSHLCEYLLAEGHQVICIDNLDTGTLENIEHLRDSAFDFRNADVIDFIDVRGRSTSSSSSPVPPAPSLPASSPTHPEGRLLRHAQRPGLAKFKRARILLASTSEVYGDPLEHPQTESYWGNVNCIGPRGVYDEAKRFAEALTMAYHRQQGVDTSIARIFNTYGPRMRPNDGRAVPTFIRQAREDEPLTVFGVGTHTRSFCYVADLMEGRYRLATSGGHEPVNLGNPDENSLTELARTVIDLVGSSSTIVNQALPVDDPKVRRPDISRARELLGWAPTVSLREGMARTVEFERARRESAATDRAT